MKEIYAIKCDSCGYLQKTTEALRTCGFCEGEGCMDCVRHRTLMKGIISTWIHNKNTINYGRSCMEEYNRTCTERNIDPDF